MELIVPSALVAAWKKKRGADTIGQRTFSSSDNNSAAHSCLCRDMLPTAHSYWGPAHLSNLFQFLAFSTILSNIVVGFTLVPMRNTETLWWIKQTQKSRIPVIQSLLCSFSKSSSMQSTDMGVGEWGRTILRQTAKEEVLSSKQKLRACITK